MLTTVPSSIAIPDPVITGARANRPCRDARVSSWGWCGSVLTRGRSSLGTHGVVTAVDVHDLAGRRREEVRQQRDHRLGGRLLVPVVPAERRTGVPVGLELLETGDGLGREGLERSGTDQVHTD